MYNSWGLFQNRQQSFKSVRLPFAVSILVLIICQIWIKRHTEVCILFSYQLIFELFIASDGLVGCMIFPHVVSLSMQLNSPMTYKAIGYNIYIYIYIYIYIPTGSIWVVRKYVSDVWFVQWIIRLRYSSISSCKIVRCMFITSSYGMSLPPPTSILPTQPFLRLLSNHMFEFSQ